MMPDLVEKIVGDIGDKRRWREYKAQVTALPTGYRTAVDALERYLMHRGAIPTGDTLVSILEELAETFEQAAAEGTPIGEVVGASPVRFAEMLLGKYSEGERDEWVAGERERLVAGLSASSAGGVGAFSFPLILLPFVSSAFVPAASMPGAVRWFAEHQLVGEDMWIVLGWRIGVLIGAHRFAMLTYRRKFA